MHDPEAMAVYDLELLPHERRLLVNGRAVELTTREFDILCSLAAHPGWVYSPERLADGTEEAPESSPDSIRVHIAHLRYKLAAAGARGAIGTVRGVGYRLEGMACAVTPDSRVTSGKDDTPDDSRRLHDALWDLESAVLKAEKGGSSDRLKAAATELERARRRIDDMLGDE